jgi:hypothetical protein
VLPQPSDPRQTLAPGTPVEVWENPDHPFTGTTADLHRYAASGDWVMLFNAMILTYAVLRAERAEAGELPQVERESLFLS